MSYRKHHVRNSIEKIRPKKSFLKKWWFWALLFFFALILGGIYFFIFYPKFQIEKIEISGNIKNNIEELRLTAEENIGKNFTKSIFLFDERVLSRIILEEFPFIKEVIINKKFPETLIINVKERIFAAIFCSDSNACFLIDEDGFALEKMSEFSDDDFIVRLENQSEPVAAGKQIIDKNVMNNILKIEKSLQDNFKIGLGQGVLKQNGRLDVLTKEKWKIYFDLSQNSNVDAQIEKLNLLLENEVSQNSRTSLRHIDLRMEDRAIICDNDICAK